MGVEHFVVIGIGAMSLLIVSFLLLLTLGQRKKLQYHKDLQMLHDQQKQLLIEQNTLLEQRVIERTSELFQQKQALQNTLEELKATQSQLMHRERMASLGELTAGIAHEIQNPLNFINNFSDVNSELADELQSELNSKNTEAAIAIAGEIKANENKINHHGKRADAIVKGMLQHSRSNTGEKELTDINALANEYLKLSFHGCRAKDKTFNASLVTNFDDRVQKLNVMPQEIGRLLLNLFNNAFYAVTERKKTALQDYEPTVSITTKKLPSAVEIKIRDNGTGIPQKSIDKIFHPFYTTKPSGQGTGLGLSLSYDIVKGHGGSIVANSEQDIYTEFTIQLPN